jgi:hypothetical protein
MPDQILVQGWWGSSSARKVDLFATFAAGSIVFQVALREDLTWLGGVTALVLSFCLAFGRWPYGALLLLIAASASPVFFVEVFGWKARPEHFAGVIVVIAAAVWRMRFERAWRMRRLDLWFAAYLGINFLSSAFGSVDPASTLRWALQNCFAVLFYFLIQFIVRDVKTLQRTFSILLGIGLIESVYGIACYAGHQLFGSSFGVQIGQYLYDVAAPYGSMYEPNLFGAYTACCSILFLSLYLFDGHRLQHLAGFLVTGFAGILSFSRAGVFALCATATYVIWKSRRISANKRTSKLALVAFACVIISLLFAGSIGGVIRERFTNLYYEGLADDTAIARAIVMQEALLEIPGHLLIGRGTASFNLSFDWSRFMPEWAGDKTWIGNAPLRVLHDTGVFGLTAFIGFFVAVWLKIRKTWKSPSGILVGLWAGTLLYAISFQSTDGTILAFTWVHLGVLAAAVKLSVDSKHETNLHTVSAG